MLSADSHCLVFPNTFFAPEAALAHPQVTVWSRDATSWQELSRWGARSVLVPDAAFALDAAMPKYPDGQGTFLIVRQDAESIGLTIDPTTVPGASPSRLADLTLESTIPELVSALAPVEFVISDRLHGGLVALLLGKKAILLPVDYHKIRSFYETWLVNVPSVGFARDVTDAARLLPELGDRTVDLTELFRAYADPALDDVLSRLGSGIAHGRHTVGARS
ncbi:polysaccharide pyruvyl transferase family protein [Desertimonas flava]|uniref:polysaccharide pyruvyl transferase family protein n=1 Tax=Desertimonas flava TaxID=2064846 RepID=UPI0013C53130|nr:polysaccharide pyruvyl transferase family protein [Desertimonas flava]